MTLHLNATAVAVLLFTSCRTTTRNEPAPEAASDSAPVVGVVATPTAAAALAEPVGPPGPPSPAECPVGEVVCSQSFDPVVCSAGLYGGRPVAIAERVMAWGSNACVGRLKLVQEACRRALLPSKLGQVQCVPDSSGGSCPPVSGGPCPSDASKPVICTAGAYGDQKLGDQQLQASGPNACVAVQALFDLTCRQNLDLRLLKDVSCRPGPRAGAGP